MWQSRWSRANTNWPVPNTGRRRN